jgi:hypothetical protein
MGSNGPAKVGNFGEGAMQAQRQHPNHLIINYLHVNPENKTSFGKLAGAPYICSP